MNAALCLPVGVPALAIAALALSACGGGGGAEGPTELTASDKVVVSPPVFGGGPSSGGTTGEPEPATPEEIDAFPDQTSTAFQIFVDPPRSVSIYCGDGVYDPAREECDDGPGNTLDLCTPNCQTRDLLVVPLAGNSSDAARYLGAGRHPLSMSVTTDEEGRRGVGALVWTEGPESGVPAGVTGSAPRVVAQLLDGHGNPEERLVVADAAATAVVGGSPLLAANPVSAVLSDGSIAVAYNDLNGDGSELGVGLRRVSGGPGNWSIGPLQFANDTFIGAQQDPDMVWTGGELVVAWVDTSDPATAPDIRVRTYGDGLTAPSGETTLAATEAAEGGVVLSPWARISGSQIEHSYLAAWRESLPSGGENLVVFHDGATFRIEPTSQLMPGHALDRPAIAPLDQDHVAVAYSVGTDPELTGVASVFRVWIAVVDMATGDVVVQDPVLSLAPGVAGDLKRSQRQPALVAVVEPGEGMLPTGEVFLSLRTEGALGNENGEDLWLKRLEWDGEDLSLSTVEVPLQRSFTAAPDLDVQDQRTPVLASLPVPGGAALGIAWEDFGQTFGTNQARPDIALQVAPVPVRRGAPVEKTCAAGNCVAGEGPCTSSAGCAVGLSCLAGRGPWFGYGPETAVCAPATCTNGVQNGTESGVDCGGSCGTCFACPGGEYQGTAHYCSPVCKCDNLDGDCDSDGECAAGLGCQEDVGAIMSLPAPIDLCLFDHCVDGVSSPGEVRIDCGGADCVPCVNGSATYCLSACAEGQGDCSIAGGQCGAGLSCLPQGEVYGLSDDVSVCLPPACEARGASGTASFCTAGCRCPDGAPGCESGPECSSGRCQPNYGTGFGLPAATPVCVSDLCFNGVQDAGETQVDCGGPCGSECPACSIAPSFGSFEDANQWGKATWDAQGTVTHPGTIASSTTRTAGALSTRVTTCGYEEVHSVPVYGTTFNLVGDQVLLDARIDIGGTGQPWEWIGAVGLDVWSPSIGLVSLIPNQNFRREHAGQWRTLSGPVSSTVRQLLLDATQKLHFRVRVNRNCSPPGSSTGATLVDNIRFGGASAYRSICTPQDGAGPQGSGSTTAGVFSFNTVGNWTGSGLASNADATEGTSLRANSSTTAQAFQSVVFSATDVTVADAVQFDIKIPTVATTGSVILALSCPAAGLSFTNIGTLSFTLAGLSKGVWVTASMLVPQAVRTALATSAANCTLRFTHTASGTSPQLLFDQLRFGVANQCSRYTQVPASPFSLGMPQAPNGTATRPYPICTTAQLQTVMSTTGLWDEHIALHANLNLAGATGQIGNATTAFSGTFDGNDFTLYGYSRTGTTDVGLFGVVNGDGNLDGTADGFIRDLTLSGFTVTGTTRVGALAGSFNGRVEGVSLLGGQVSTTTATGPADIGGLIGLANGAVVDSSADAALNILSTSGGSRIGGLAGSCQSVSMSGSSGTITKSTMGANGIGGLCGNVSSLLQRTTSTSTLTVFGQSVGALAGLSTGTIEDSTAFGQVNQQGTGTFNTGGLVGRQTGGVIRRSSASGNVVSAGTVAGGLVGLSESTNSITDCYATGAVQASTGAGGLAGHLAAGTVTVTRSYARGVITAGAPLGTFAGTITSSSVNNSYASSTANSGMARVGSGSTTGITAVTDAALALQATYTGWDFTAVWFMSSAGAELR